MSEMINPKGNSPEKKKVWGDVFDAGRRIGGRIGTFFGYDLWKEIETHPWGQSTIKSAVKANEWLREYVKDADVHFKRQMLTQGKLYIFDYDNPKYESILDWWDTEPLVVSLGTVVTSLGPRDIGINMHLLPPKIRKVVLVQIFNMYNSKFKGQLYRKDQKEVQVKWSAIAKPLEKFGIGFAIRMYIPERRTNIIEIRYEDWKNAIFLQSKQIKKATMAQLEAEWAAFVLRTKNTRLNESWTKN